jgi:HEAT repeats
VAQRPGFRKPRRRGQHRKRQAEDEAGMEKRRLKREGLAFGRNLQRSYKLVALYITTEHASVDEPVLKTYEALNDLLKQAPQFTFGFFNHRVVLNDLLTPDPSLDPLEAEFVKRNIMAVCFSLGITFREFKRGLVILTTKPESIQQQGGTPAFVRKNPVEGMRILASEKHDSGDTDLGMDFQAFMVAQTMLDPEHIARSANLHLLMQSAGEETPVGFGGSAKEVLDLVDRATQSAFVKPDGNPKATVDSLTRLLEELSPDFLISALPEERAKPLRGKPADEVAYVLAEDVALEWARRKFFSAGDQAGKSLAEEQIIQVLGRALRTTQVADRLLQKIGEMTDRGELPVTVTRRLREEMNWASWTLEEKHSYLMKLQQFSLQDYRHLIEYMKDVGREGLLDKANQVADHYLACVEAAPAESRPEGMAQVPELIRILTGMHSLDFVRKVVDQFCEQLRHDPSSDWQLHRELTACLAAAAQSVAMFEDFEAALTIGEELARSRSFDPEKHAECCDQALHSLLSPATVERMIELSLKKIRDQKTARAMGSLLRLVENQSAEIIFRLLEEEKSGAERARLLHLARQLGDGAFNAARKRLEDERWYVVRNACYILGALNDPDLATHLEPALRHPDTRVQQAAITAVIRSNAPGRGGVLVRAISSMQPHLQEMVLDELLLLKDPSAINPLEGFLLQSSPVKTGILEKAMRGLIAIPDERIVGVVHNVLIHAATPMPLRRLALQALKNSPYPVARQKLEQFRMLSPTDPLTLE